MKLQQATKKNCIEILVMAAILFAGFSYFKRMPTLLIGSGVTLLLAFISPQVISPLTRLWLTLGHILGVINSKVLLVIVFFVMVTPIALIRRVFCKNQMTNWSHLKMANSTFKIVNKQFSKDDFDKAF